MGPYSLKDWDGKWITWPYQPAAEENTQNEVSSWDPVLFKIKNYNKYHLASHTPNSWPFHFSKNSMERHWANKMDGITVETMRSQAYGWKPEGTASQPEERMATRHKASSQVPGGFGRLSLNPAASLWKGGGEGRFLEKKVTFWVMTHKRLLKKKRLRCFNLKDWMVSDNHMNVCFRARCNPLLENSCSIFCTFKLQSSNIDLATNNSKIEEYRNFWML